MLEIEQQFPCTPRLLSVLEEKFGSASVKNLQETYFDDQNFSLLKNDTWLRQRNGQFELKYRQPEHRGQQLEIYDEFADEKSIKVFLDVPAEVSLETWVNSQLKPIINIQTTRHTFKKGPFTIDVDMTDFGYNVCEIEYAGDITPAEARKQITLLAQEIGLENRVVKNKAKAFVEKNYPEVRVELHKVGII